ncbi:MAG: SDR family NAD(P)-dependent oxidoreductase [Nitrospinota bacterium]
MRRLEGRVGLITGGSRGLGRGIALAFAEEGASVALSYLQAEKSAQEVVQAIESRGSEALAQRADVTEPDDVANLVEAARQRFGRIDILVNNAGIASPRAFTEMTIEEWDQLIAVHLRGMFLCSRNAVPLMLQQGKGKIINMVGSFGIQPEANWTHLSTAKAGMIAFTQALGRELGPKGVRVNAVCPAMTKTEMIEHFDPKMLEALRQRYPLRRLGEIEDVTATVLFLASDDSDFFTGQTLAPCGGDVMV